MIAIALGLIGLVVLVTTGVAVSSSGDDHLAFLGIGVETTTAQVFLTGAIFAWLFVIALWLLRFGVQRSNIRCAQLAVRRARRGVAARRPPGLGTWLGFGAAADGHQAADAGPAPSFPDAGVPANPPQMWPDPELGGTWFGAAGPGPAGDDGGPPQRGDGGQDFTHLSVAVTPDQAGAFALRDPCGPGARGVGARAAGAGARGAGFVAIGVDRRGQGRQVGR